MPQLSVEESAEAVLAFLREGALTETISQLEFALQQQNGEEARALAEAAGIDASLLAATMVVRAELGRINDLIHACGITLALPRLLEPGERITVRPSLAAGNDPSRPYDLETNRRVAEFKLSIWAASSNAMRKRQTFKDLAALAMDDTGRKKQLFVVGGKPAHFLKTSRSTADWALNKTTPPFRARFAERYGSLEIPISEFTQTHAAAVEIVDLAATFPDIFTPLQSLPAAPEIAEIE